MVNRKVHKKVGLLSPDTVSLPNSRNRQPVDVAGIGWRSTVVLERLSRRCLSST